MMMTLFEHERDREEGGGGGGRRQSDDEPVHHPSSSSFLFFSFSRSISLSVPVYECVWDLS